MNTAQNVYFFRNGTQVIATNLVEAFRAFRVAAGAASAILDDVRPLDEVIAGL